ncbi:MAG TPA: hypothetical protein VLB44_07325 [Kofleriaceae bacterium]|nr:hypothetical protein [Kofleriaceae bacterium]
MQTVKLLVLAASLAACDASSSSPDPAAPDAAVVTPQPDAPPPGEPKPAFTAGTEIGGQLAIDDTGIRETFTYQGGAYLSVVTVSLTETATNKSCGVTLGPKFVAFGHASTSTRQFKTVVIDFANSKMLEDKCGWDDAYVLAQLDQIFGHYIVGFAQARFAEDQPYVDVYLDAVQPFPNSTANIVRAGGGAAYQMSADGTVTDTMVQPAAGTLVPALYDF